MPESPAVTPTPDPSAPAPRAASATAGTRLPRAARRQQLIDVAQDSFARKGYQGTTIENIAAAAGVTRPIVYNCFGSKDGIYLACLSAARQQLEQRILEAVAEARDTHGRVEAGIDAYFRFVAEQADAWDVLFGGGAAIAGTAERTARELRFRTVDQIAGLLQRELPDTPSAELDVLAHAVSGAAEQVAKWWRCNPATPRPEVVQRVMRLLWAGLEALTLRHQPAPSGNHPLPSPGRHRA